MIRPVVKPNLKIEENKGHGDWSTRWYGWGNKFDIKNLNFKNKILIVHYYYNEPA